jgi:PAT family beta-lactamase induction signal transducer AmpG
MMSLQTPSQTLVALSLLALLLAFLSASNDVVIDAYRTDLLSSAERGVGSNFTQLGYRVAMMVSGALVLILSKPLGWGGAYQVMALVMAATMLVTWWSVEPAMPVQVPATLRQAVVEPLKDFATRPQMGWLLLFITFYKVGDATALSLSTAFFIKGVGFSVAEVGAVAKVTSFAALIIGTIIGGFLFLRLGLFRALLWFGVLQSLTNLLYSALALVGHDIRMLVAAVGVDYTAGAMGSAAFGALLMALCDRRFSAAQFALLTAIAAIPRSLVGPLAASLVEAIGWPSFFVVTFAIGLIPLGLLLKLKADVRAYDVER